MRASHRKYGRVKNEIVQTEYSNVNKWIALKTAIEALTRVNYLQLNLTSK